MLMLPHLTDEELSMLERLRCLRLFWKMNPQVTEGQTLPYWHALQLFNVRERWT